MTGPELCEALEITPKTLTAWKKRGLPYTREGRAHVYQEQDVFAWLVSEGLAEAPRVVKTRDLVADHFGVNLRTVATWLAAGAPGKPGAYDLDAIAAWKDDNHTDRRADPMLQGPADAALTRYRLAKAEKAELELAIAKRETIPMADIDLVFQRWADQGRRVTVTLDKQHGEEAGDLVRDWIQSCIAMIRTLADET